MNCKKFVSCALLYVVVALLAVQLVVDFIKYRYAWSNFLHSRISISLTRMGEVQERVPHFKELTNPEISAGTQKWDGISCKPYSLNTVCR